MKRFLFLLLLFAAPAFAQSDETMRHAATMKAVSDLAAAMKAQAETIDRLSARVGMAPMAYQPAAPQVIEEKPCEGFGGCLVAGVKATFQGVREVGRAVGEVVQPFQPFAAPYAAYRTADKQFDYQKVAAIEQTKQVESREQTTRYMAGSMQLIATAPQPTPPPTTQNIFTSNTGPILVGSGSMDNSVRPAPTKYCFPVYSSAGVAVGSSCI